MQRIVLTTLATLFLTIGELNAQTAASVAPQQVEDPSVQEMRLTAGSLKGLLAELNDQLRVVTKLSETTDRIAVKRLVQIQEEIKADISQTEGGLDRMSGMSPQAWSVAKDELIALDAIVRKSVQDRTKGLKEAFGEK